MVGLNSSSSTAGDSRECRMSVAAASVTAGCCDNTAAAVTVHMSKRSGLLSIGEEEPIVSVRRFMKPALVDISSNGYQAKSRVVITRAPFFAGQQLPRQVQPAQVGFLHTSSRLCTLSHTC